ncbi:HNH endonuclease [Acinetobacter venetianus]|uniref:HNH endonuclease 5 domain-containing protein n=1 Tax=Acinetobacter venetianus TaxID=52133 RepID=A0A150HQ59_9GAMM|nr:HNH endonuclease [Acinetobacter venetianus]KXZ68746.1 hypothetical protein AVENLUH13518_02906 [Acinetobacter venetianus]
MKIYTEFTVCIICLQPPNDAFPQRQLTDEHIVSEFLGGKIIVKNVCKECNDKLGLRLEGPLSKNRYFKIYTHSNGIKGKKDKLTNPLSGEYSYDGVKFRYEADFSLYQLPVIRHQPVADGGFEINASIDTKDLNKIEHDIFKIVSRRLKKSDKTLVEDKLKEDIKKIIESNKNNINIINQPEIQVSFSLDFDQIALLALKISYELLAWLVGEDFILSNEFDAYRSSLKNITLHNEIKYSTKNFHKVLIELLKENTFFKVEDFSYIDYIFGVNKTLVIFIGGGCFVRIANLWINFEMPESLKNTFFIFSSDSKTGGYNFYREEDIFLKKI